MQLRALERLGGRRIGGARGSGKEQEESEGFHEMSIAGFTRRV
jgi:hypothetical protein